MRTIVTGATGGLGRNLVASLLEQGHEVLAFGRNAAIGNSLGTPFKAFDLADTAQTQAAFTHADVVFHCAALSSPWGRVIDFQRANVLATENVLKAIKAHDIGKLVHVSTSSVYFNFTDQLNVHEDFLPKQFVNAYAASKYAAEQLVRHSNIPSVILRPRGIFGEHDTALLPRLLRIAKKGSLPLIKRPGRVAGSALVDVTYTGNVVHALLLAAATDLPAGTTINITNHEPLSISTLYNYITQTLGIRAHLRQIPYTALFSAAAGMEAMANMGLTGEPLLTRYGVGLVSFDQTLDTQAARHYLNYTPPLTILEGLEHYARHSHEN